MKRFFCAVPAVVLLAAGLMAPAIGAQHSAGSKALAEANASMHSAMSMEMTGDVEVDFMRAMIPHHQGAIDMAKIVIENGKDPEVRKLAEEIVKAQEAEIAFMKTWLEQHGAQAGEGTADDHSAH